MRINGSNIKIRSNFLANEIRTKLLLKIDQEMKINSKILSSGIMINSLTPYEINKKYAQKIILIEETIFYSSSNTETNSILTSNFNQNTRHDSKDDILSPCEEYVNLRDIKLKKKIRIGERKFEAKKIKDDLNINTKEIEESVSKVLPTEININNRKSPKKRHNSSIEIKKVIEEFGELSEEKIINIRKLWKICRNAKRKYFIKKKHLKLNLQECSSTNKICNRSKKTKKRKSSYLTKDEEDSDIEKENTNTRFESPCRKINNTIINLNFNNSNLNTINGILNNPIRKSFSLKGEQILGLRKSSKKKVNIIEKKKNTIPSPRKVRKKTDKNNKEKDICIKTDDDTPYLFDIPKKRMHSSIDGVPINSIDDIEIRPKSGFSKGANKNCKLKKQLSKIEEEREKEKDDKISNENDEENSHKKDYLKKRSYLSHENIDIIVPKDSIKKNSNNKNDSPKKLRKLHTNTIINTNKILKTMENKKNKGRKTSLEEKQVSFQNPKKNNINETECKQKPKIKLIKKKYDFEDANAVNFFSKKQKSTISVKKKNKMKSKNNKNKNDFDNDKNYEQVNKKKIEHIKSK